MLAVGKVLKPHGIKGDIKVESFLDSPDCFLKIKNIIIDYVSFFINKCVKSGNFLVISLKNIESVELAERLRGKTIYCEESELPKLPEGKFYIYSLIGCKVIAENVEYGIIKDVLQYGSSDVIVCDKHGKTIMFAWIKALDAKVDLINKTFIVNKERLSEVIVNDD